MSFRPGLRLHIDQVLSHRPPRVRGGWPRNHGDSRPANVSVACRVRRVVNDVRTMYAQSSPPFQRRRPSPPPAKVVPHGTVPTAEVSRVPLKRITISFA